VVKRPAQLQESGASHMHVTWSHSGSSESVTESQNKSIQMGDHVMQKFRTSRSTSMRLYHNSCHNKMFGSHTAQKISSIRGCMSSIVASSPRNLCADCVLTRLYEVNGKISVRSALSHIPVQSTFCKSLEYQFQIL